MAQRSILPASQQQVRHCKRPGTHDQIADPPPNSGAAEKSLDRFRMHGIGLIEQWARGPLFRSAHRLVQCRWTRNLQDGQSDQHIQLAAAAIRHAPHCIREPLLSARQKLERPARSDGSCAIMDRRGEARVQFQPRERRFTAHRDTESDHRPHPSS
jgi:hypothetical protein